MLTKPERYDIWAEWLSKAQAETAACLPPGAAYILIDDNQLGADVTPGRRVSSFLERDGQYWGSPEDDATAIRELGRLAKAGASFLVFAWPAFWWLEYYAGFAEHVRSGFRCVLENERVIVFDLREGGVGASKSAENTLAQGSMSPQKVFTEVYARNQWGGQTGRFFSGSGSHQADIVLPYVEFVREWLREHDAHDSILVDLGCGDFAIGSHLVDLCQHYIGADVVAPLIALNTKLFGSEKVEFVQLDITSDPLPRGNLCVVRQVLQHLSNAEIAAVLPKLDRYRWVLITEHHPLPGRSVRPNVDISSGKGTRMRYSSGVFLDETPFSISRDRLQLLQELRLSGAQGMLRTYLHRPSAP